MTRTILAALLAPVAMAAMAGAAWAAQGDPIPSKDIVLQGDPSGIIVSRTRTGRDGRFVIAGLRAGTYTIRIPNGPTPRAAISTSRSNIKKPSSIMANGVEVVTIEAELGIGPAEATFMIGADRGRVVGIVRSVARPR